MNSSDARRRAPVPMRIFVRGTNWLGDAIMTTPALLRLREKFPDAHVALLTPEKLGDLWTGHPAINETITFAPGESVFSVGRKLRQRARKGPRIEPLNLPLASRLASDDSRPPAVPSSFPSPILMGEGKEEAKFDLALVFPNSPRSAIETWLADIPRRIGYARPWRNFFLTQAIPPRAEAVKMRKPSVAEINQLISRTPDARPRTPASAHQIHEYLQLVAALGANPQPLPPQLFIAPDEIDAARKKFGLAGTTGPIFGLNPGAEYGPAKRWPVGHFIAAAREIQKRTNCVWILFGGTNDTQIAGQIEPAIRHSSFVIRNLCGQTSLRGLMALLKSCRVLLTNDSGPMHVAAALGTPVVVPFGSTSPELTGPGLPGDARHRLLKPDAPCAPCFRRECPIDFRCLNGIPVEHVVDAVLNCSGAL